MLEFVLPMDQQAVKQLLPHRDPMLFVDRVTRFQTDKISIESDILPEDPHFKGHFPGSPILPGVIIVETNAQAGALLVNMMGELEDGEFMAFSSIDAAKFKKPVYPNETLLVDVEIVKRRGPFYKFAGHATVNGKTVAKVDFSAAKMAF